MNFPLELVKIHLKIKNLTLTKSIQVETLQKVNQISQIHNFKINLTIFMKTPFFITTKMQFHSSYLSVTNILIQQ